MWGWFAALKRLEARVEATEDPELAPAVGNDELVGIDIQPVEAGSLWMSRLLGALALVVAWGSNITRWTFRGIGLCCRPIVAAHSSPFDTTGVIGSTYAFFVVEMFALWALLRARSAREINLTAFTSSTNLGLFKVVW